MKTPAEFLLLRGKVNDFTDLISRFSVEVVRKEFFNDYIDAFIRLYIAVLADTKFVSVLQEEGVDIVKFTKNLLGKIVFVYFVQKKGWLGLNRDGEWGYGDRDFVRSLWGRFASGDTFVRPSTNNFYNDYLEHLFYNGFNKDRRDDNGYEPVMRMKVPYLNGGLFKEDYKNWEFFDAKISNDIFSNTAKTGILDIFDTYNFTIDEDDIHDSEVAVDPEMLGKIFEKMISVSSNNIDEIVAVYQKKGKVQIGKELNKQFGAFYTPREIVHYMTRESLIAYLSNGLRGSREENEMKIRTLISAKDRHLSKAGDIDNLIELEILISIAEEIDMLLQRVKILDPAVGSGAFPMGILHEISTLRYYLHSEGFCTTHHHENEYGTENLVQNGHISMYQIKRDTIKNSIYGVDIEPGAIDIARLRFWLSLVVDATEPEPLPNFEFKFVAANTLIPLHEEDLGNQMQISVDDTLKIETIRKYMLEYYDIDKKKTKEEIVAKIKQYISRKYRLPELSQMGMEGAFTDRQKQILDFRPFDTNYSNPFFDPSLMMGEARGFDIVMGNPPYIKEYDNRKAFDGIRSGVYYMGKMDIWYYFGCLGLDLLKEGGIECYIAQNNWITSHGAKLLRSKIMQNAKILEFIDFGNYKVFDDIGIQTMIYILQKNKSSAVYRAKYAHLNNEKFNKDQLDIFLKSLISSGEWSKYKAEINRINGGNTMSFNNDSINSLCRKILTNCVFLSEKEVGQGIVYPQDFLNQKNATILGSEKLAGTGIFVLSKQEKENMILDQEEYRLIKPLYTSKEISRYNISKDHAEWVIYTDSKFKKKDSMDNFPNLKMHLDQFSSVITSSNHPYGLHRSRDKRFFLGEKIVVARKCTQPTFGYASFDTYVSATFNIIKTDRFDMKYLTALLNSTLIAFWLRNKGKMQGNNYQLDMAPLIQIPLKNISPSDQQPFITLVDAILSAKRDNPQADTSDLEKQIDTLVYKLYDLTPEEILVIVKSSEK